MNGLYEQAKAKLESEYKSGKFDRYGEAMKKDVRDAVLEFCQQDAEFAQAVVQGGSFEDCMKAVARGCGSSISDISAYKKAVQFYFPGSEIRMTMELDLAGAPAEASGKAGVLLDLSAFF